MASISYILLGVLQQLLREAAELKQLIWEHKFFINHSFWALLCSRTYDFQFFTLKFFSCSLLFFAYPEDDLDLYMPTYILFELRCCLLPSPLDRALLSYELYCITELTKFRYQNGDML